MVKVCFKDSNLEIKSKHADDQSFHRFVIFSLQIKKREYYHYAQVDFDFGQVHIV